MLSHFLTRRFLGLGLLILVGAVVVGAKVIDSRQPAEPQPAPVTTVRGLIGGSKGGLLKNPEVEQILRDKYQLEVKFKTSGSGDMVNGDTSKEDFIWPADQLTVQQYQAKPDVRIVQAETIFNSPLVLYAWDQVAQALIQAGYVKKVGETYYVDDFGRFASDMHTKKEWKSTGLELYGPLTINTTDPCRSNSGNSFAGLLANLHVGGVADETSVRAALSPVRIYFDRLGHLEPSSTALFRAFLTKGIGANPIIINYESLFIEYYHDNPAHQEVLRTRINTLYPKPTVWASHILIATTEKGRLLLQALKDKRIQAIAWERHGFRTGLTDVENDPRVHAALGFAPTIESVIPLPRATVMDQINSGLCPVAS